MRRCRVQAFYLVAIRLQKIADGAFWSEKGHVAWPTALSFHNSIRHHFLLLKKKLISGQPACPVHLAYIHSDSVSLHPQCGVLGRTVLRGLVFGRLFSPHFEVQRTSFFSKETMLKPMSGLSQIQDKPSKSLD